MANAGSNQGLWKQIIFCVFTIVGSWLLGHIVISDLFGAPVEVYIALVVFWAILLLISLFFLLKKLSIKYYSRLQYPQGLSLGGIPLRDPSGYEISFLESHKKIYWRIKFLVETDFAERINGSVYFLGVDGPFCPKDNCLNPLRDRDTSWGRYRYKCTKCNFKKTLPYSCYTLMRELEDISKNDIKNKDIREDIISTAIEERD